MFRPDAMFSDYDVDWKKELQNTYKSNTKLKMDELHGSTL